MLHLFDGHEFFAVFGSSDSERFKDSNEDVIWISSCIADMISSYAPFSSMR